MRPSLILAWNVWWPATTKATVKRNLVKILRILCLRTRVHEDHTLRAKEVSLDLPQMVVLVLSYSRIFKINHLMDTFFLRVRLSGMSMLSANIQ